MLVTLLSTLTALVISFLCTPIIRKLAIRFKVFAAPNHRTIHKELIPKLGGGSIFMAFVVGMTVFAFWGQQSGRDMWGMLIGASLVFFVGLFDDIHNLSCYRKFLGQTLAAGMAVYFGFTIYAIHLPFDHTLELGYLGVPLSVLWIVGITNAVNLLDGLDGLAAGFSILITLFILICAGIGQNIELATAALIILAASLGFLRYNFPPAKIFMGDAGSLFLGFCLACLSLKTFMLPTLEFHFGSLLVLFAIPLADTSLAIFRRLCQGKNLFSPDKKHIHHRLLEQGLNQLNAVLVIYAATFLCGLASLVLLELNFQQALLLFLGMSLLFIAALNQLGCFDFLADTFLSRKISELNLNQKQNR